MKKVENCQAVVIGGSAGCVGVIMQMLKALPSTFHIPIIIIIHRQRNVVSEMAKILSVAHPSKKITEPEDKEPIKNSCIYLAPQNYHLLIERNHTFSLDYSELVQFSRPSIDVTFESAAQIYKSNLVAILLSGANNDGTAGLQKVIKCKGTAIVQSPDTADYKAMPENAIANCKGVHILQPAEISSFLTSLQTLP
jgi:two-component system, chemotaxis family, protein-glutamate methylesterase/glutaminase